MVASYAEHFADLDEAGARELATFTMAMADGLFVAREIRGDDMDLVQHFETLAVAVLAVADDLAAARPVAELGCEQPQERGPSHPSCRRVGRRGGQRGEGGEDLGRCAGRAPARS